MSAPIRPERAPLDQIVARANRRPLDEIVKQPAPKGFTPRELEARKRARLAQNEAERTERTVGEQMATIGVTALDDATFGLAGLATDALSPGDFRTNRDARRAEREMMPTRDRVAAGLIGGL